MRFGLWFVVTMCAACGGLSTHGSAGPTASPTPGATPTPTHDATPTATMQATPTPRASPTDMPSPSPTQSPTPTVTPRDTPQPTIDLPDEDLAAFSARQPATRDLACLPPSTTPVEAFDPRPVPPPPQVLVWGHVVPLGLDVSTLGCNVAWYDAGTGASLGPIFAESNTIDASGDGVTGTYAVTLNAATLPAGEVVAVVRGDAVADTWTFGLHVEGFAGDPSCTGAPTGLPTPNGGCIRVDLTALAVTTYDLFPILSGLPTGIDGTADVHDGFGRAAVIGRVRDCADHELRGAAVGLSLDHTGRAYFDGGDDPRPTLGRTSTNTDGLSAFFNVAAGAGTLTATGRIGGVATTLGTARVLAFPDSVTIRDLVDRP